MKKLIVANFKMNPEKFSQAEFLVNAIQKKAVLSQNAKVVLCLPHPWLTDISHKKYKGLSFGAQNVFWESAGRRNGGAYTGEISPQMLKNSGVEYVIIGHSERRKWLGETDEMINKKIFAALKVGLKVILCVGEPERKRELRFKNYDLRTAKNYVKRQLGKDLKNIHKSKFINPKSIIITYEPVWAISTNKNARADKPENALEMIRYIKSQISNLKFEIRVLYGGSVTSKNARSFLQYKEIDGALVGGASLKAEEFIKIIKNT